jgi:hypothetical protein
VTVWTRVKDESSPAPTAINVQISRDPTFLRINSTVQNGFVEYDPVNNPEQALFSFQIRRGPN